MKTFQNRILFFVNGTKIEESNPDPRTKLLSYLRRNLNLSGTKYGCGEGYCGACTVMLSWFDRKSNKIRHEAVVSCLLSLVSVHGKAVTTIEALGSISTTLHPVQERLAKSHGTQCGFCSPGMVMSMYTLLRNDPHPTVQQVQSALKGNLCRCTGYRPILDAFNTFAKDLTCSAGNQCCQLKVEKDQNEVPSLFSTREFIEYDPSQEPIFPSELQIKDNYDEESLKFERDGQIWFRPGCIDDLLKIINEHPKAKLIAGNTDIGFSLDGRSSDKGVYILIKAVTDLQNTSNNETGMTIGAGVTLGEMKDVLNKCIQELPEDKTRLFTQIVRALDPIESEQILNAATIGGHIATASPISDIIPILVAGHSSVKIISAGQAEIPVTLPLENVFGSTGGTTLKDSDVLTEIHLPYSRKTEYFASLSQKSGRIDLRKTVNAGMRVEMEDEANIVKNIDLMFNGLGTRAVVPGLNVQEIARGQKWNKALLERVSKALLKEISPVQDGRIEFRKAMIANHFISFFNTVEEMLSKQHLAADHFYPKSGNQIFSDVPEDQDVDDNVGRPIAHLSAEKHVTGEALYVDDIPKMTGELFMAMVTSSEPHAKVLKIDASAALGIPGVKGIVTHKDAVNNIHNGAEIIASDVVHHVGQFVVGVVGETREDALKGAKHVLVDYEPLTPILSIEEAINQKTFMGPTIENEEGDVSKGFAESAHLIEGEVQAGGQLHFYMETQSVLVVPKDGNEFEVYASTQNPAGTQNEIAKTIGVPANKVHVRTKRVGGSFGGKESQGAVVSSPCAVAAAKFRHPVRCILPRQLDKPMSGGRHPILAKYKVGVDNTGKCKALQAKYYLNGGYSVDLSIGVMVTYVENNFNLYAIPNVHVCHQICRTNLPSNTAFRGFGVPQVFFVWQEIIGHIASELNLCPSQVHERNFYKEGDSLPHGQELQHYNLPKVWDQLLKESQFYERKTAVDEFNRKSSYKKRGIAVTPMGFGPGFSIPSMNQATALVHIYLDGSVLVAHGGVEMGQGLHTKTTQVASRVLGVPVEIIHQSENCTATIANSTTTAASSSTDLYGAAVQRACQVLVDRLKPFKEANPNGTWKEWVNDAHDNQISLSAVEHFAWEFRKKTLRPYLVFGASCSEVEIDCLTGDHELLRTDIVMDIGKSLNPAIDVGQIEGAFVQGYGYYVKEEVVFDERGSLKTRGPLTYRIPRCTDIPGKLNVHILKDCPNNTHVYSSKAIGEPPLVLAASAFCAVKSAVAAFRANHGFTGYFRFDAPASAERIILACSGTKGENKETE